MQSNYDVIIIGGGAAGLYAALCLDERIKTAILEKQPKAGRKLLSTGNGRCNFGNINISHGCYHGSIFRAEDIVRAHSGEDFAAKLGILPYTDSEGRLYPYSRTAASVCDTLLAMVNNKKNTDIYTDFPVREINFRKGEWLVTGAENRIFAAKKLIFAAGGKAAPKLGTDGSALAMLEKLGIRISPPSPALCPFLVKERINSLKGVRADARISLKLGDRLIYSEHGEVQFGDNYISGICVMNASCYVKKEAGLYSLSLDLFPDMSLSKLTEIINRMSERKLLEEEKYSTLINKKILSYLKVSSDPRKLAFRLKNMDFKIKSLGSFDKAQTTAGGVCGSELDSFLEVKKHKNLFIIGEGCDVHGNCGGYNLMWAWASAFRAAKKIDPEYRR